MTSTFTKNIGDEKYEEDLNLLEKLIACGK